MALIALQSGLVTNEQFLVSFETWLADRSCGLGQVLVVKTFLTKRQRESLVSNLISILEQSNNNWRMGIAGNTTPKNVYNAMETLATTDAIAIHWIELVGEELGIVPSKKSASKPKANDSGNNDPYGTFDFDDLIVPYATLSNGDGDESK